MSTPDGKEWLAYYGRFPYFSTDTVRDGYHPRVFEHEAATRKAIVLCHGLKEPKGMEGVELGEWKANVRFAVQAAAEKAARVSIGGLSTGGALSFYMACTKPRITGDLYLFSAALDLAGGPLGLIGEFKEWLLGIPLIDALDSDKPLIGRNPYRYDRMDVDGAKELARLIKETDDLLKGFDAKPPFPNACLRPIRRVMKQPTSRG